MAKQLVPLPVVVKEAVVTRMDTITTGEIDPMTREVRARTAAVATTADEAEG